MSVLKSLVSDFLITQYVHEEQVSNSWELKPQFASLGEVLFFPRRVELVLVKVLF